MGGKTAMKFSLLFPEMVEKLIVVDIAPKVYSPDFKNIFKKHMKTFCGSSRETKYLKFCSNLFNCVKAPRLFYEVMNDIFDLDMGDAPKLKKIYDKKKKNNPELTKEAFYKEEKESRAEGVSNFVVKVLFIK